MATFEALQGIQRPTGWPSLPKELEPLRQFLDSYFDLLARRVNEIVTVGKIADRPGAGLAGRWFFSTDEVPPKAYFDNGAAWTAS